MVSAAVDAAVAAGHELVFLVADADDWPRDLYAKLGFREIGRVVADAAFGRYVREAADYAGGRRIDRDD